MQNTRFLLVVFIAGFCGMILEIAGGRLIAPYLGTTIFTWSAIIGLVLGALSVGYYIGGRLGDKYNDTKHFTYILLAAGFLTLIVPFLARIVLPFTYFLDLSIASILAALIFVPASFFYGMVSPYAIKLITKKGSEGANAGDIFSLSTVGSISGVLITGFILIPYIPLTLIFVLGAVLMFIAVTLLQNKILPLEFSIFLISSFFISTISPFSFSYGELIYETETPYYYIAVAHATVENKTGTVLIVDSSFASGVDKAGDFLFSYAKKMRYVYPLLENPKRIAVLGAAAGTQVTDLQKHFPNTVIDAVELDGKTVELGKEYFGFEEIKTNVFVDDARRFIRTTDSKYDLVIVDTYRGRSMPYHLSTREFASEIKQSLTPDGIVAANVISPIRGKNSEIIQLLYLSYKSEFKNVILLPADKSESRLQNIILIASDRDLSTFVEQHSSEIITDPSFELSNPPTDELNPIELFAYK